MKLFDYVYYNDYGVEHHFQFLSAYPWFALIESYIQWDEFPAIEWFPSILIGFGPHDLFGFSIRYKWFQFKFSLINFQPRNFHWYRRNKND